MRLGYPHSVSLDARPQRGRTRRAAGRLLQIVGALFVSELLIPVVLFGLLLGGWALYETLGVVLATAMTGALIATIVVGGVVWRRRQIRSITDSVA